MSDPPNTVEAVDLTKRFGRRAAVASLEFTLDAGDCLALFGPNGAGKTTLLRLVAGLLKPTAGHVRVRGRDLRRETAARSEIGLVSHQSMLYPMLSAVENVAFAARLQGLSDPWRAALDSLAGIDAASFADTPVRRLSRGQAQRVSIARAMVHGPRVVLLDEPYTGLDESGAALLTTMLAGLRARGATLLLATHNVAEGLAIATHAAIMRDGFFASFERRAQVTRDDASAYATRYRELVLHG